MNTWARLKQTGPGDCQNSILPTHSCGGGGVRKKLLLSLNDFPQAKKKQGASPLSPQHTRLVQQAHLKMVRCTDHAKICRPGQCFARLLSACRLAKQAYKVCTSKWWVFSKMSAPSQKAWFALQEGQVCAPQTVLSRMLKQLSSFTQRTQKQLQRFNLKENFPVQHPTTL